MTVALMYFGPRPWSQLGATLRARFWPTDDEPTARMKADAGVLSSAAPPRRSLGQRLRRFWYFFAPYWAYWQEHGYPPPRPAYATKCGEPTSVRDRRRCSRVLDTLLVCWDHAGHRQYGGQSLPVLNSPRSPCIGCGAKCCQTPPGQAGFTTVVVYNWEPFAARHAARLRPSARRPGEQLFDFDKTTGRCPFLSPANRCSVYADRPLSCRVPECVDHLDPDWRSRTCMSDLVAARPDIQRHLQAAARQPDWITPGAAGPSPDRVYPARRRSLCCYGCIGGW